MHTMAHFRCELFEDPIQYEETPLRDRKENLPCIAGGEHLDKKVEFLKDIISLANSARLFGKPAYLLFGITNTGQIRGIEKDLPGYRVDGGADIGVLLLQEKCRQIFKAAIHMYISPHVSWELVFGECRGRQLAYMKIAPLALSRPFQVCKELRIAREVRLACDSCWIRFGESKYQVRPQEISPDDDRYRYAYSTVPYALPTHWSHYFSSMLAQRSIADDALMPYYIEQHVTSTLSLAERIRQFLDPASAEKLLVIEGEATTGKSVFLNRLCHQLAAEGLAATKEIINREEFLAPTGWIPISFPLRNRERDVQDAERLVRSLLNCVNRYAKFWDGRPSQPERLFEERRLHWLICFDGLDEIATSASQRAFLGSLSSLMERYPNVRVLLTTRPYPAPAVGWEKWPGADIVCIIPLHERQISGYVASQIATVEERGQIMLFLSESPELLALCSYPGYLIAAIQELVPHSTVQPQDAPSRVGDISWMTPAADRTQGIVVDEAVVNSPTLEDLIYEAPIEKKPYRDEIRMEPEQSNLPRVGIVLQRVYDYLWEREAARWNWLKDDSSAMWDSASKLAIETDGRILQFPRNILNKHLQPPKRTARQSLLTLGILHQPGNNLWAFQNPLVKTFFAAWWIRSQLIGNDRRSARKKLDHCNDGFLRGMHNMLVQLYDGDLAELFPERSNHDQRTT